MIKVNLLPIEKRKAEGTPLPRFMAIVGGVVGVVLLALACAFFLLQSKTLDGNIKDLDDQIANAKEKTLQVNKLEADVKAQRARGDAIAAIEKSRSVLWCERLDRVAKVLDKIARKVWLTQLKCTDNPGGAAPAGVGAAKGPVVEASMELACQSTKDLERNIVMGNVTVDFVEAMRKEFIEGDNKDFTFYDDRYSTSSKEQANFVEGWSEEFKLVMQRHKPQQTPMGPPR